MGQSSIGNAALVLSVDGKDLQSGLKDAEKRIDRFGKEADRAGSRAAKRSGSSLGAGIVGGLSGAVAGGAVGVAGRAVDFVTGKVQGAWDRLADLGSIGDIAQTIGISGTSASGMFGLADSAGSDRKDMTENIATLNSQAQLAAADPVGKVGQQFKALGIDAKRFVEQKADDQFYQVLDAISKLPPGVERLSAGVTAFGEEGAKKLLPLFGKGAEELRSLAKQFESTNEEIAGARAVTVAYGAAMRSIDRAATSGLVSFAPEIVAAMELVPDAVKAATAGVKSFFAELQQRAEGVAQWLARQEDWRTRSVDWVADKLAKGGERLGLVEPGTRAALAEDQAREAEERRKAALSPAAAPAPGSLGALAADYQARVEAARKRIAADAEKLANPPPVAPKPDKAVSAIPALESMIRGSRGDVAAIAAQRSAGLLPVLNQQLDVQKRILSKMPGQLVDPISLTVI